MTTDLSVSLASQESIIQRGVQTFAEVGAALSVIRDQKMYRENYKTFEAYCEGRWDFSRAHAYRLIDATEVLERIKPASLSPKGDKNVSHKMSPAGDTISERHVRPLIKLPKEEQAPAFEEAKGAAEAEGKPLTAKAVQEVVARRMAKEEPEEVWEDADAEGFEVIAEQMKDLAAEVQVLEKKIRAFITPANQDWKAHLTQRGLVWGLTKVRRNLSEQAPTGGDPQSPNTVVMGQVANASTEESVAG